MLTFEEKLRRFREEKERQKEKEKKKKEKERQEAYRQYQEQYRLAHGQMKTSKELARDRVLRRKALEQEKRKKREKEDAKKKYITSRTVSVYGEKWLEREAREEDLYTKSELMNPPEGETGAIRWDVWERLVNEYRSKLENERSWKHELSLHNP